LSVNLPAVQMSPVSPLLPVTACDEIDNPPSCIPVQSGPKPPFDRSKSSEACATAWPFSFCEGAAICTSVITRTRRRQKTTNGQRALDIEALARVLVILVRQLSVRTNSRSCGRCDKPRRGAEPAPLSPASPRGSCCNLQECNPGPVSIAAAGPAGGGFRTAESLRTPSVP